MKANFSKFLALFLLVCLLAPSQVLAAKKPSYNQNQAKVNLSATDKQSAEQLGQETAKQVKAIGSYGIEINDPTKSSDGAVHTAGAGYNFGFCYIYISDLHWGYAGPCVGNQWHRNMIVKRYSWLNDNYAWANFHFGRYGNCRFLWESKSGYCYNSCYANRPSVTRYFYNVNIRTLPVSYYLSFYLAIYMTIFVFALCFI